MVDLIYVPNPNAQALTILLQETKLEHRLFAPAKVPGDPYLTAPLLLDEPPIEAAPRIAIRHTGAALIYLAQKTGHAENFAAVQWVMWQTSVQVFRRGVPLDALTAQVDELFGSLDRRLREHGHIAGNDYSIADVMCYPWVRNWVDERTWVSGYPSLAVWLERIGGRPAVVEGMRAGGQPPPSVHPLARAIEIQTQRMLSGDPVVGFPPGRPPAR
jgi:GST-like protein